MEYIIHLPAMSLPRVFFLIVLLVFSVAGKASSFPELDSLLRQQPQASAFQLQTTWLKSHPMLYPPNTNTIIERPRKQQNKTGLFLSAIVLLYAFAGFRLAFGKNLQDAFSWLRKTDERGANRRTLNNSVRYPGIFSAVYLACLAYVLYHYIASNKIFMNIHTKGSLLLFSIALCFGLYALRYCLQRVLVWTFLTKEVYEDYQGNMTSITQIGSVILFPVCIVMLLSSGSFFQVILYTSILVIGFITLWRYARMIRGLKKIMSIDFVHFFLYLCAFEILPILAAGRFMLK